MGNPQIKHDLQIKFGSMYGLEEETAVLEVLRKDAPTSGNYCIQFEKDFAEYCGTEFAISLSTASVGLDISMMCLDLEPGDEVICPAVNFKASPLAVLGQGGELVFCEIDPRTFRTDVAKAEASLAKAVASADEAAADAERFLNVYNRDKGAVSIVGGVKQDFPRRPFFEREAKLVVARAAGVGAGVYTSADEAFVGLKPVKTISPDEKSASAYQLAYEKWRGVLEHVLAAES